MKREPEEASELAYKFMELFEGMSCAYGTYTVPTRVKGEHKKVGQAQTIRGSLSAQQWDMHLKGKIGLGVIPIMEDSMCWWGAIDIDQYTGFDVAALARRVRDDALPFVVCRTKSGGAHIYVFLTEPMEARDLRERLTTIASGMGFGGSEIFPKQVQVLLDKGDVPNWINMPYFDASKTTRMGYDDEGNPLDAEGFLKYAEIFRTDPVDLRKINVQADKTIIKDGPPCLQFLVTQGFPEGVRNRSLFNLGVYARKRWPDEQWKDQVRQFNKQLMIPPLSEPEVATIIKSLNGKGYQYTCKDTPICSFCNAAVCRTRTYGIGGTSVSMEALSRLDTDPVVWFMDIDGTRLQLTTEQLQSQTLFQRRCMESIGVMPTRIKEQDWIRVLSALMENLTVISTPPEGTAHGEFMEYLEAFCTDHTAGSTRDSLLQGMPWLNDDNDRVYFRLRDLQEYMNRRRGLSYRKSEIIVQLKEVPGADTVFFNIKGRGVNTWHIPRPRHENGKDHGKEFDIPNMKIKEPY